MSSIILEKQDQVGVYVDSSQDSVNGAEKSEIDFSVIPGTSNLVENDEVVLIPTPSDDPNDPLNWSRKRKWLQMFCIILYCYGGSIPGCCIYSITPNIAADPNVNLSVANITAGTGYSFLFLGLGNLFWLPIAQQYGKRPVYLLGMLGVIAFNIWQPWITNNGQWIASKIMNGFFYSTIESLPEITVTDMYFEHERATYMGIYGAALFSSNYAAPMLAGFVNDALGWKWTIIIAVIFTAVCFVAMFFLLEETNYDRKLRVKKDVDGTVVSTITSNNNGQNDEIKPILSHINSAKQHLGNQTVLIDDQLPVEYPPEKTFVQKLSLTSGIRKDFHLFDYMVAPLYMVKYPVVLWSGFLYGASLFWYTVLNATEAVILGAKPYNFSPAMCGLAYLSPVIFVGLIYPYAGWSTDWIKIFIAKKHGGVSQAEDRLWVLVVYMILGPASLILWGVGASKGIHWFGIIVGLGLQAGLCIVGCISSVTYTLDTYPEMGVPAITVLVIIRNTMNFAMGYGITPFIDNMGVQNCFIISAFICLFCIATFFVMVYTGKYWRNRLKNSYWKLVVSYREKGIAH